MVCRGSTQSVVEVWTRQIKETLTDKRTLFLTWQERYVETLAEQHGVALVKRLKAMEKINRIVHWSLQHCAAILESLQTKKTVCWPQSIRLSRTSRLYIVAWSESMQMDKPLLCGSPEKSSRRQRELNSRSTPTIEGTSHLNSRQDWSTWMFSSKTIQSQVSNSLGDSLLRGTQRAVMLHNVFLGAAEERHLTQADLQNSLLYCQQELGLFEEALASLGQSQVEPTRFQLGASVLLPNKTQNILKLQQAFSMLAGDGSVSTDVEEDSDSEDESG